ncbi:hypothetical protein AB0917_33275, partial [Streptomyces sp. NPDC007346]
MSAQPTAQDDEGAVASLDLKPALEAVLMVVDEPATVDRNSAAPKRPVVTTGQYVVRPGDTLFSIAFR